MALIRLGKHFLSLSPIFEVFSTQIYSQSILSNLTFGGARYIATGHGLATTRISFTILYSRFAGPSVYMGMWYCPSPLCDDINLDPALDLFLVLGPITLHRTIHLQ